MVKDRQALQLFKYFELGMSLREAALRTGLDEKTARKYLREWKLPGQLKRDHTWQTRENPFAPVWKEITEKLKESPGLQAKTILEWLGEQHPAMFHPGQLRTLQRHIKAWRALEGPGKEVYFPQVHEPGRLAACDFTHMDSLEVTILGELYRHLYFHLVLTYSNWETGNACHSESWESFSDGLQRALWKLGGVPAELRTDSLSAAIHRDGNRKTFTASYQALLSYYGMRASAIQPRKANQNGDVEQGHNRFKMAVEQALLLRGRRDFESKRHYFDFIEAIFAKLNAPRMVRWEEDRAVLRPLPAAKLEICKRIEARVGKSSSIRIQNNTYSVHSRLRGENVQARIYIDYIEVWYAQRCIERLPRLQGRHKHHINYRHIIDWLVRKPGAFESYRYLADMFPTSNFRIAYDALKISSPGSAVKEYLAILKLAATDSEELVNNALRELLSQELTISAAAVRERLSQPKSETTEVEINPVCLALYDSLLETHQEINHDQQIQYELAAGS